MKDGSNRGAGWSDGDGHGAGDADPLHAVIFDFEDTGNALSLLPLAARRALDVAGFRLSLDGWQSLGLAQRKELAIEGARDAVDASSVEESVRRSAIPATRIRPVPDPDPLLPPEQLSSFLGPRRSVDPAQWARLRALDRYALVHVLRRSIAHDDPMRLEAALGIILPRVSVRPSTHPTTPPPTAPSTSPSAGTERRPSSSGRTGRRLSPGPSTAPRSPKRSPGEVEVTRTPSARSGTPSTERRSASTSARATAPAQSGAASRARGANAPGQYSEPPPRQAQASRRDEDEGAVLPDGRFTGRGDGLGRGSVAPARGSRHARGIEELDDLHPDERDFDGDSLSPGALQHDRYSTHLSDEGEARMVDVGDKAITLRRASAQGSVRMRYETALRVVDSDVPKGDVLSVARIAGIMAAKRAPEIIPLCHHVALTKIEVHVDVDAELGRVTVVAIVEARDRTGVEMEALAAVTAACLTVYDMLKGIDRDMVLSDIKLLEKSGGRTGSYVRHED